MRGENWPMASWTTTIVMVSTRPVSETIDAAMVDRMNGGVGVASEPRGNQLEVKVPVDGDGDEGKCHPGQDTHDRTNHRPVRMLLQILRTFIFGEVYPGNAP